MTLLLAKFLPSNRGKYTPPVPPVPPTPTYSDMMLKNRGSGTVTFTYVHEGETGSTTLDPAKVTTLPYQMEMGKKVSATYESLTAYFPGADRTITYDVNQTVNESTMVFSVTDMTSLFTEGVVTIYNPSPDTSYDLCWRVNGDSDATLEIDPLGAYDLPTAITLGNTIGSMYDYVNAQLDGNVVFDVDLSTAVNSDITLDIVPEPAQVYTVTFETYGGTPLPNAQEIEAGGHVTEPTAPTVATPQGYDTAVFQSWWNTNTPAQWDFENDEVGDNMTLSAFYAATRAISVLDEQNGSEYEQVHVYYSFAEGGMEDYLLSMPTIPTDPTGQGRNFNGWGYEQDGVVTALDFSFNYPDTEEGGAAAISTDATEIFAIWEEPSTFTVTFMAYEGTPAPATQTVEQNGYATEPTPPSIPQASMPQGYLGDGASNGWWVGSSPWTFATTPVTGDVVLSTYYNVYRTIPVLGEPAGTQIDTAYANYSFVDTVSSGNDYVSYMADPTDPSGQGRQFAGWRYEDGGEEHILVFDQFFPDGGDISCGAIPTTVTEIYATWEVAPIEDVTLDLGANSLSMAPSYWENASGVSAGGVTCSPYVSYNDFGTEYGDIVYGVGAGTLTNCTIIQDSYTYSFDTFSVDGPMVEMSYDDGETNIGLTLDGNYGASNDMIFLNNLDGVTFNTDMDPTGTANAIIILDYYIESTEMSYIIDTLQDTQGVFLGQANNPACAYICDFSKVVNAGSDATITFTNSDSQDELEITYTWDSDASIWNLDSISQTGFGNVNTARE